MCGGDMSILGALDFACLCCVCAGVCAAVAMRPESARERRANVRAFTVNMCMGDFVEVSGKPSPRPLTSCVMPISPHTIAYVSPSPSIGTTLVHICVANCFPPRTR
eukprot:scaffold170502_cov32-Tisochrysis_lutea.AAC.3